MFRITKAQPSDRLDLAEFFDRVIKQVDFKRVSWVPEVYPLLNDLVDGIYQGDLYIAEVEGQIAGVYRLNTAHEEEYPEVHWQKDLAEGEYLVIHILLVDREFQGRGVAKALLTHAKETAKAEGAQALRLDVFAKNRPAKKLYEKAGFVLVETMELRSFDDKGADLCDLYEFLL